MNPPNILSRAGVPFTRTPKSLNRETEDVADPWANDDGAGTEADTFKMVLGTRRQLGETKKQWYIIDPRRASFVTYWDATQVTCLIFTAFVTPLQVAFTEQADSALDPLFLIDRCIDCIFAFDMVLQFFLMYPSDSLTEEQAAKQAEERSNVLLNGTTWVMDHGKIAKHYLTTWFPIDILSIAASATDIVAVIQGPPNCDEMIDGAGSNATSKLRALRVLRVLRLMKLVRLLKASRVLKRWMSRLSISYGTLVLVKCMCLVLVCSHWIACVWKLQTWFAPSRMGTWEATFGLCVKGPDPELQTKDPSCGPSPPDTCPAPYFTTSEAGTCCMAMGDLYVAAITWSLMIITGVGGTDLVGLGPANGGISTSENLVFCVLIILGNAILWTQVIAAFVDVASNANPLNIRFRQTMDDLNAYMEAQMMPSMMKRRLREYFQEVHGVHVAEAQEKVVLQMSPMLQREVVLRANKFWLQKLWFIRGAESAVFVQIVINLQPYVFAPGELAPDEMLFIINKGVVVLGREILVSGNFFGHDAILVTNKSFRSQYIGRMMSYVQCSCLSRFTFEEIISRFPEARRIARRSTILMALRAAIIKAAAVTRKKNHGFLDIMLDAAQTADTHQRDKGMPVLNSVGGGGGMGIVRDIVRSEIKFALASMNEKIDMLVQERGLMQRPPDAPTYHYQNLPKPESPMPSARAVGSKDSMTNGRPPAVLLSKVSFGRPGSKSGPSLSAMMARSATTPNTPGSPADSASGSTSGLPLADPQKRGGSIAAAVPGKPARRIRRVKKADSVA